MGTEFVMSTSASAQKMWAPEGKEFCWLHPCGPDAYYTFDTPKEFHKGFTSPDVNIMTY